MEEKNFELWIFKIVIVKNFKMEFNKTTKIWHI